MSSVPPGLAFDEVLRNLTSSRLRTATLVLLSAAIGAAATLATITDLDHVSSVVDQQYAAGSSAIDIAGPSGRRVDAVRCHALEAVDGVVAAGGVMDLALVRLDTQPDAETRLLTVTPGFIPAAWPTLAEGPTANIVAGSDYQNLAWHPGDTIRSTSPDGVQTIAQLDAVADTKSVLGDERIIAISAPPQGSVASCLVLAEPTTRIAVAQASRDWFGAGTSVNEVFVRSDLAQDPQRLLDARISRFGWAVGGVALVVVMLTHWVARRSEFALYRLHHVRDRGILAMFTFETVLLALVPAQAGALLSLGARPVGPLLAASLSLDWLRLDLVVILAPVLGLLAVPRGSLLAALKGH